MKFNENRPKGSRDMEHTRNSRVNPLTLTLNLVSWVMCYAEEHFNKNRSKGSGDMERTRK